MSRGPCAAREGWRYAVNKFGRGGSVEERSKIKKGCNTAADVKRWKTVSKKWEADETTGLSVVCSKELCG